MEKRIIKKLERILPDGVSTDPEDLVCASYDGTRKMHAPEVLVRPECAEHVAGILELASAEKIPVYPAGARSGLTGGALALEGGIALDLLRMNRIIEINPATRTAVAEAGVVLGDLREAARRRGLFYPPDPASAAFATLGGTLAECAGGLTCVKYGVTRDYVLALEAVLPTGEIIHLGSKAVKNVVGYDVMRLLVGSEGTLAVITRATVRLRVLPEKVRTMLAWFPDVPTAAGAVTQVLSSGVVPRMLEFMDAASLEAVRKYAEGVVPDGVGAALLVEVDGTEEAVSGETRMVRAALEGAGATNIRETESDAEREELLQVRRNISPALYNLASGKMNEDVCVPLDRLVEAFKVIGDIGKKYGLLASSFAHAGDGNVHVNFMYDASDPESLEKAESAAADLFAEVVKMGGSLSGEHGIGTAKRRFLGLELGNGEIALMKKIKDLFDPAGILNPGKIFPRTDE